MQRTLTLILVAALAAGCFSSRDADTAETPEPAMAETTVMSTPDPAPPQQATVPDNPLLKPWTGPYGGVPPFDQVRVSDFKPALEAAMAEALANMDRIAGNPPPATFENTLAT